MAWVRTNVHAGRILKHKGTRFLRLLSRRLPHQGLENKELETTDIRIQLIVFPFSSPLVLLSISVTRALLFGSDCRYSPCVKCPLGYLWRLGDNSSCMSAIETMEIEDLNEAWNDLGSLEVRHLIPREFFKLDIFWTRVDSRSRRTKKQHKMENNTVVITVY